MYAQLAQGTPTLVRDKRIIEFPNIFLNYPDVPTFALSFFPIPFFRLLIEEKKIKLFM